MADAVNHEYLTAFRRIMDDELQKFIESSSAFGGLLQCLAMKVKGAFEAEHTFMMSAINMQRPPDDQLSVILKPLSDCISDIVDFRDSNRHEDKFLNHLSMISSSIPALSWVAVFGPAKYVREMKDAGDYYGNRVLAAHRREQTHVAFVNSWGKVLSALQAYIHDHHNTGFDWAACLREGNSPALVPSAFGSAPAPPPPPPPSSPRRDPIGDVDIDRSALFNQINAQGENITDMLKPRRDVARSKFTCAGKSPPHPETEPDVQGASPQKKPKFVLEGKKWHVDFQNNVHDLVVESLDMSESVSMFECHNVGLDIRNKMNGVSIDNTKKSTIVVKDIISSIELIRCSNLTIQCNGNVPMINIDKCDSVQIFLSEKSHGVDIVSANTTSLNVCILKEDGDYVEYPVPEQICTRIVDGSPFSTVLKQN